MADQPCTLVRRMADLVADEVGIPSTSADPMPGLQPRDSSPMQEQTNGPFAPSSR